jgi:hypothetical protein
MSSMDAGAYQAPTLTGVAARLDNPVYQAYQILHVGFTVAPIIAGVDKFFHFLVNWDQYLAPIIAQLLPISGPLFMRAVGVIEIVAGLILALKPRIGGYIVGAWLLGIVINLLLAHNFYDIALRDFGLALGAFALARMGETFDRG